MELDDLRRQWQQPEPAASVTSLQLDTLFKGRTLGLVEKMLRNAWLEAGFNLLVGLVLLLALPYSHDHFVWLASGVMLVVVIVLTGYYYQMISVLRRMAKPTGSVRGHLTTLAQGLRQLLRFYYRFTIASGLVSGVVLYGFMLWQMAGQGRLAHRPVLIVGLLLLVAALTQLALGHFTRQYLQRLYGRHLDRLEGQLRELDEESLTPAQP